MQDKFHVLKGVQDNIIRAGGKADESNNACLAEEAHYGKTENDLTSHPSVGGLRIQFRHGTPPGNMQHFVVACCLSSAPYIPALKDRVLRRIG